jgi:hypothetical protein
MAATREGLEALINIYFTRVAPCQCADHRQALAEAVQAILREVDEYTSAEIGLLTPAERRHILFEGTS